MSKKSKIYQLKVADPLNHKSKENFVLSLFLTDFIAIRCLLICIKLLVW